MFIFMFMFKDINSFSCSQILRQIVPAAWSMKAKRLVSEDLRGHTGSYIVSVKDHEVL